MEYRCIFLIIIIFIQEAYPRESLLSGELLVKQVEHYIDKEKNRYCEKIY